MTWRREPPEGRVWALVLWDHSYHPIPKVAQYDPPSKEWFTQDTGTVESWPADQCEWHPLPHHERFDEKTHALSRAEEEQ